MSQLITLTVGLLLSLSAFSQDLSIQGFNDRFTLVKNSSGKVQTIKLKRAVRRFTIAPFLNQLKADLLEEQARLKSSSFIDQENEIDEMLYELDLNPYAKGNGSEVAKKIKEALQQIPHINVENTFAELQKGKFWAEFQRRLNEAFLFIDPTVLANLDDPRFFYKRNVTYKVVEWALQQAQKTYASIPVLNIATFVIFRAHDMLLEQRYFHHNMLLHYFETIPETRLGMTKEEVDRAVSSIFEYRIGPMNLFESNRAARDWLSYGMNNFYMMVRSGNNRVREWSTSSRLKFTDVKKVNFGFAQVTHKEARKIYHLHHSAHQFTKNPALAFDYSRPQRVKRNRALLNLAGIAIGFVPHVPGQIKGLVDSFIKSFYVQQVRTEGALVGYFESTGDTAMIDRIYSQRANFYIIR